MRSQASLTHADAYWRQAALVLAQFDGLVQGYRDTAPTSEVRSACYCVVAVRAVV